MIAVILAVVGVYGLISETVASRTPEIGVRMALGATRLQVMRLVVGTSLGAMAIGVTLGLAGAAAAARSLGTLLFGVPPIDPVTLVVMPATFMAIAGLASLASARRATRIDPVIALRNERGSSLQLLDEHLGIPPALLVFLASRRRQIVWRPFDEAALGLEIGECLR